MATPTITKSMEEKNKRLNNPTDWTGKTLPVYPTQIPSKFPVKPLEKYTPFESSTILKDKETYITGRSKYLDGLRSELEKDSAIIEEYKEKTKKFTTYSGVDKVLRDKYNKEYNIENIIKRFKDNYSKFKASYTQYESEFADYESLRSREEERYRANLRSARDAETVTAEINNIYNEYEEKIKPLQTQKKQYENAELEAQKTLGKHQEALAYDNVQKTIEKQIEALEAERRERVEVLKSERDAYYEGLTYNDDFEEKSKKSSHSDDWYELLTEGFSEHIKGPEKKMLNYIANTQGDLQAKMYAEHIKDYLVRRKATKQIEETEALPVGFEQIAKTGQAAIAGVERWGQGVANETLGLIDTIGLIEHNGEISPTANQYAVEEHKRNSNAFGRFVYNLAESAGNMAPSILLSTMTGNVLSGVSSAATATKAARLVGGLTMGYSAAGNAYSEGMKNGWSKDKAMTYGILVGTSEVLLEKFLGGISALGGGSFNLGTKATAKILATEKAFRRVVGNIAVKGVGEGIEEGLQTVLEPLFATMLGEEITPAQLEEVLYSAALGFFSVGLLESVDTTLADKRAPLDSDIIDEYIRLGKKAKEGSLEYVLGKELRDTLANNPEATWTAFEIGRIVKNYKQNGYTPSNADAVIDEKAVLDAISQNKNTPTENVEGKTLNRILNNHNKNDIIETTEQLSSDNLTGIKGHSGIVYNDIQAKLLAELPAEALQNASGLSSRQDITFNAIGISDKQTKQAWINAGLAYVEKNDEGQDIAVIPETYLYDERERRAGRLNKNTFNTEVNKNGNIEGYDGIGETQLREDDQEGLYSRTSDRAVADDTRHSERGNGRTGRSDSEKQREIRQGVIRNVFHGTPYSFSTYEKSYVDLGIHFGTEEQAKARLDKSQGKVLQKDLKLENPLVTQDIFGERTPEEYVKELLDKSELSDSEKGVLKKVFDNFIKSDVKGEARTSLKDKLSSGKYQIKTKVSQEGVLVSLAIVDDTSNVNNIPLVELIDKNKLVDILGFEETAEILKSKQLSDTANKSLNEYLSEVVLPFEMQYLKLRKIENILKSFGYDGFAYRNENEGEGWSYAVFDNEQISESSTTKNTENYPTVSRDGIEIKPESDLEIQERLSKAKDDIERTGILSGASDHTIALARRLEKLLGVKIRFELNPIGTHKNGRYNRVEDTIYVNMSENNDSVIQIISHEFMHSVEGTRLHAALFRFAEKMIDRKNGKGTFNNRAHETIKDYEKSGETLTLHQAQNEVVCNFIADNLLKDEETIKHFVREHRTLAERFQKLIDRVLSVFSNKATRAEAKTRLALEKANRLYKDAMKTRKTGADLKTRVDELRQKYQNGEITEEEFDRAVDELSDEATGIGLSIDDFFKGGGDSFSISRIKGDSGKDYGIGVYLDSSLLTNLNENDRKEMVKERVVTELSGQTFIAYDNNGNSVNVKVANTNDKIQKSNGRKRAIIEELYRRNNANIIKQEAVVLSDELIQSSKFDSSASPKYSHDWLDNHGKNDWEYWKVYLQEKNKTVWEATLNIANTANGEKVLYDINPIRKVEGPVKSVPTTTDNSIPKTSQNVNSKNFHSISTPVFTPEKVAKEVADKAENNIDIAERLPKKAHMRLREVEKKLCKDIAKVYGVRYDRIPELQEAVRTLVNEYLTDGSIDEKNTLRGYFANFMKDRFGIEDMHTYPDGTKSPLTNQVKHYFTAAIRNSLQFIKANYEAVAGEVNRNFSEEEKADVSERVRTFTSKKVREARDSIISAIGIKDSHKKDVESKIYSLVAKISEGKLKQSDINVFFNDLLEGESVVNDTMRREYSAVYDYLKSTKLTLTEEQRGDLPGYESYKEYRESAGSTLLLGKDGTSVEDMWAELRELSPGLFPEDIINTSDMAVKILEVANSFRPYKESLADITSEEVRNEMRLQTERAVNNLVRDINTAVKYAQGTATVTQQAYIEDDAIDIAEITDKLEALKLENRKMLRARSKTILSDRDERALSAIIDGVQTVEALDDSYNKKDIQTVYEASKEYYKLKKEADEYKSALRQRRYDKAKKYLADGDVLTGFRDHSCALLYMINPLERNLEYIGKRSAVSQALIDAYVKPIKRANQAGILYRNAIIRKIEALKISQKAKDGNEHSEAFAVQFVGEARANIEYLSKQRDSRQTRDGKNLEEWQAELREFWKVNPAMSQTKIDNAVEVFREIYDELFRKMNEARVRSGYDPVTYRKGYFPHFNPRENNDYIALFGKSLGFNMEFNGLPTTINGLTHTFKPGIKYFGAAQERQGFETVFDAVEGMQRYLDGVIDVIFQTDNIQNLRALAHEIRYQASDDGKKHREDRVRVRTDITETERNAFLAEIHEKGSYTLSNFVNDLEEYTNILAGKKSKFDRGMESFFGRDIYNFVKNANSKIAANMIAWNVGSWLTNFIPLVQGSTGLETRYMLEGMAEALKNAHSPDGFEALSVWLTTRRGADDLVKSWQMNNHKTKLGKAWASLDALSEAGMKPMEWIDMFVSNSLVRGRYKQNIAKGLDHDAALEDADSWVSGLMADRSKGGLPTIFNSTNPIFKTFTQFQVEVANQYGYFFKDVPKDLRDKNVLKWCLAIFKYLISAYLFNELYEKITGRRPAFDPAGIINDTVGNISGVQLDNAVDVVFTLAKGEGFDLTKEVHKMSTWNAIADFTAEVSEELPFVSGLLGGGRIPTSSAMVDIETIGQTVFSDTSAKKKWLTLGKELAKPVTYSALPGGGGQIAKTVKGIRAVSRGGKYTVDSQGRDKLQYPITPSFGTYLQAGLFGPTATKGGQEWISSGFSTGLNAEETMAYQAMIDEGITQDAAFDILDELGNIKEKDGDLSITATKAKALANYDTLDSVKRTAYEYMYMRDRHKEYAYLADEYDIGKEKLIDFLMENHDARSNEELVTAFGDKLLKNGKVIKKNHDLTTKEKAVIYQIITNNKTNPYNQIVGKRIWKIMNPDEKY